MAESSFDGQSGVQFPGSDFIKGATGMPVVRQMALLIAIALSIALAIYVTTWIQTPDYRPIGPPSSPDVTSDMVSALQTAGLDFKLDQRTGSVLVPADAIYNARMILADAELIGESRVGYEIWDKEQSSFGVSQFREFNDHRRAIEGELAKSITTLTAVAKAKVILATPKTTTFIRDKRRPSASVVVTLKPARSLAKDQVRGIMNLVAAAVPELRVDDVVVVDQSGKLLSRGVADDQSLHDERDLDITRAIERDLYDKVANILTPWVGMDRFTAEVKAAVDFTRQEKTEELYNPQTSVRSEQESEERVIGQQTVAGGVPGTLSNTPPEFNEVATEETKVDEERSSKVSRTRNYELDRTINYVQQASGTITRLSISVIVDDIPVVDAESGETKFEAWADEDIEKLTAAVKAAVGFDNERGDTVAVVNRAFYRAPEESIAETPFYEQTWFMDLIKQVLGGLALIVVVFGLLRPLFKNLSQAGEMVRERQSMAIADMAQAREAALQEAVPGLPTPITTRESDTRATKMETVRNLVHDDPARVAQVVKSWVGEE